VYLVYLVALITLFIILWILLKEEKKFNNITYGLTSEYWILREKRRFVRFKEEMKARYNLLASQLNHRYSTTKNISRSGLCILAYEKFKEKNVLAMEIEVPGSSRRVKLIGQVIWTKEQSDPDAQGRRVFLTGIKFCKIDPESEAMLITYLNKLKRP